MDSARLSPAGQRATRSAGGAVTRLRGKLVSARWGSLLGDPLLAMSKTRSRTIRNRSNLVFGSLGILLVLGMVVASDPLAVAWPVDGPEYRPDSGIYWTITLVLAGCLLAYRFIVRPKVVVSGGSVVVVNPLRTYRFAASSLRRPEVRWATRYERLRVGEREIAIAAAERSLFMDLTGRAPILGSLEGSGPEDGAELDVRWTLPNLIEGLLAVSTIAYVGASLWLHR